MLSSDIDRAIRDLEGRARGREAEGRPAPTTYQSLTALAGVRKDVPALERYYEQMMKYRDEDQYQPYFWGGLGYAFAEQPARAREMLTRYEQLIARGTVPPPANQVHILRSHVLVAERKHAEALQEARRDTVNHIAMLGAYRALLGLGRQDEARAQLQALYNVPQNYALDVFALPVARYLYGRQGR